MGYKMNGSPHKMGTIIGASAFKQKEENIGDKEDKKSEEEESDKALLTKAKSLIRLNVGNTTVDSPNADESKFDASEKEIRKAINILKQLGYTRSEIEEATGAEGYKAAMDWVKK